MSETVEILDEDDVNTAIESFFDEVKKDFVSKDDIPADVPDEDRVVSLCRGEIEMILDLGNKDELFKLLERRIDERVNAALEGRDIQWRKEKDALIKIQDLAKAGAQLSKPHNILQRIVAIVMETLI